MILSPQLAALVGGFLLILVSAVSKDEKWQSAYGVLGLILIFWGLGFFGLGRVVQSMVPALTMLFGIFALYTKGSAQLICILVTIILFCQIVYI
jgi:hypothetical protein